MVSGMILTLCSLNVSAQYQMVVNTDDGLSFPFNVNRIESVSFRQVESNDNDYDLSVQTIWTGKNIAWFGTSIPAGTERFRIPIKGNTISSYGSFRVAETVYTADDYLPSQYPLIVASLLGAKEIHNESQGSSRITRNATDSRLEIRCKALTNTVQEICSYVWGSYNIDIKNRTYSENHDNTIGIKTFLTTTSWKNFVDYVCICLRQSYQICLTLRHLISDNAQRTDYIADIFGDYLDDFEAMLATVGYTMDDITGYHAIDLFVIEHSVNDSYTFMHPLSNFSVDSDDVNDFYGAYNKIIAEILRYNPSVRIVIVSNCGKTSIEYENHEDKVACLKRIAERWQLPFCQMDLFTNVQWVKQQTQGYWDSDQCWHDSGFEWTENVDDDTFSTNACFNASMYDESLAAMKAKINPQKINGVWYWEAPSVYLWMFDALHPHSDKSGRLTILIARVLSRWLLTIGRV